MEQQKKTHEEMLEEQRKAFEKNMEMMEKIQMLIQMKINEKSGNSSIPPLPCGQPHDKVKESRVDS